MTPRFLISLLLVAPLVSPVWAEGEWEITRDSEQSLERGLEWMAKNQGRDGNWSSNDVGLVSLGALAFLA
ncbi:MAG: squalene--hopene cyclase, partial [Planctomycetia bacterium]|nr:squalene--hopene cyclase [Planctomycetia bacterium]